MVLLMMDGRSPTEVQDWFLCPQFWTWRHVERWRPKTVSPNEVQSWIGTAIHRGISEWVMGSGSSADTAWAGFAEDIQNARALGRDVDVDKTMESGRIIFPALGAFYGQAPEWLRTACRGVEITLGHARLDWIGRPGGEWVVVDFKTKRTTPKDYGNRNGMELYQWELRRSWQFAEYLTLAMNHPDSPAYGGVVGLCEVQTLFLDTLTLVRDRFIPAQPSEGERLRVIRQMAPEVTPLRRRDKCRNWFGGDCPYLRACWDYEGDPERMSVEYVQEKQNE